MLMSVCSHNCRLNNFSMLCMCVVKYRRYPPPSVSASGKPVTPYLVSYPTISHPCRLSCKQLPPTPFRLPRPWADAEHIFCVHSQRANACTRPRIPHSHHGVGSTCDRHLYGIARACVILQFGSHSSVHTSHTLYCVVFQKV